MAVKTKAEIIKALTDFIGENNSDEAIGLLDDVSDTIPEDSENLRQQIEDLRREKDENDKQWRQKYIERFNNNDNNKDNKNDYVNDDDDDDSKPLTFENLFKEEK